MRVFVLLFNSRTENEGIHTIQLGDRNKVLMFESEDDATRFGLMLEAQDFPTAVVESLDEEEIKEFCESVDYDWELIPAGALALPPESNVEKTDWQPEVKRDSGGLEREPEVTDSELEAMRRRLEGLL